MRISCANYLLNLESMGRTLRVGNNGIDKYLCERFQLLFGDRTALQSISSSILCTKYANWHANHPPRIIHYRRQKLLSILYHNAAPVICHGQLEPPDKADGARPGGYTGDQSGPTVGLIRMGESAGGRWLAAGGAVRMGPWGILCIPYGRTYWSYSMYRVCVWWCDRKSLWSRVGKNNKYQT